jgi:hypothetical protein
MAERPVFVPVMSGPTLVRTWDISFKWFAGMHFTQAQKSIDSLHEAAKQRMNVDKVLEISSKSKDPMGIRLSAFNLMVHTKKYRQSFSVECAYQSAKVFEHGGPYKDIREKTSREAKQDPRLRSSGKLTKFHLFEVDWELEPKTAFYDWLYINALHEEPELAEYVLEHRAFTDIVFNPDKSLNCQAYSAALYVALHERGLLTPQVLKRKESYLEALKGIHSAPISEDAEEPTEVSEGPAPPAAEEPMEQAKPKVQAANSAPASQEAQPDFFGSEPAVEDVAHINETIARLHDALVYATVDYDIWWVLKGQTYRDRFQSTMERHTDYFSAAMRAHHVATIAGLYSMYEKKGATVNIPNLLDAINKLPQVPKPVRDELAKRSAAATKTAKKISLIRNNVFGHKSKTLTTDATYKKAGLTADELKHIIDQTRELLNFASSHIDGSGYHSTWNGTASTVRLLEALKTSDPSASEGV